MVYAAATLLLGYPVLAGRFLASPTSDQYLAGFAFREFTASWMRQHGGVPLWNPYLMGGVPHVAAMAGDLFYAPSVLLRLALPTDVAMTWSFMLHVFLAGLFAYLFLRGALHVGFFGALLGGLAYMLGGNVAGLVSPGHDGKLYVAALLPLVLLLVHRGVRDGRAWSWGALAIAVTLAILTPHPQLLQYLLLVSGAYGLFVAVSADPDGVTLPRRLAVRRLGFAALAVGFGFLGSAIQYWPVLQYTAWSPRAGGAGWEHAISYSMPPEELLNTYLPQFSGILDRYWGRNGIHFHSEYIGAAVLVLASLAVGVPAARRRQVWFWLGTLIGATLWALGGFTPFYHIVYALVPGTKYFRAPSTMLYVVAFSVAVLAAFGTERALGGRARPRALLLWVGAAALVGVAAAAGALTNLGAALALPQRAPAVDENTGAVIGGAWRSFLAVAGVCSIVFALLRGRLRPAVAGGLLAAIVAIDLWSVVRLYWTFSPRASVIYAADPIVNYLATQSDSGRVVTLAIPGGEPVAYNDPFLRGDALMTHRIRQLLGYHGNELGRYQRLYGIGSWPDQMANPNFWRLTNLRFVLTNLAELPIQGAVRVAGPVRNAAGSTEYLYRLPGDNPPAWVAPLAVQVPEDAVLSTILDSRFEVGRAALFDSASTVPTQPVPPDLPAPLDLKVQVTSRTADRIVLAFDRPAPRRSALVVSENYYPGWTASVGGRPAPVGRANLTLIGVGLPAGARQVELAFTSPRYETGKAITVAVLGLAGVAAIGGVLAERRRRV